MGKVICITGIDTDIGKTIVTGLLGRYLLNNGHSVITQKICQTGNVGTSDDIKSHRKIMGIGLQEVDHEGLTCPYIFDEPCSPHLAAVIEAREIDPDVITHATTQLTKEFEYVLLEGVGGLMVPLTPEILLIDYLKRFEYEHILVSCSRLGSINHTLSSLELFKVRKMNLRGIVYNRFLDTNERITQDSKEIFSYYLRKNGYQDNVIDMLAYRESQPKHIPDFSTIIA